MTKNGDKLEDGLLTAMQALDNQIAREMQRDPQALEMHGVTKFEPIAKRVERVTSFILNTLGENNAQIDSVLVLAESFTKALELIVADLGTDGLGKMRTSLCAACANKLQNSSYKTVAMLNEENIM